MARFLQPFRQDPCLQAVDRQEGVAPQLRIAGPERVPMPGPAADRFQAHGRCHFSAPGGVAGHRPEGTRHRSSRRGTKRPRKHWHKRCLCARGDENHRGHARTDPRSFQGPMRARCNGRVDECCRALQDSCVLADTRHVRYHRRRCCPACQGRQGNRRSGELLRMPVNMCGLAAKATCSGHARDRLQGTTPAPMRLPRDTYSIHESSK
eukprot:Amastigsp_a842664_10.p3 type:complete len:208 gc:universal Amastigsp_a842664_10:639-16(-)